MVAKCGILRSRTRVSGSWPSAGDYLITPVYLCWDLKNVTWNMKEKRKKGRGTEKLSRAFTLLKNKFSSLIFGRSLSMPQATEVSVDSFFFSIFFGVISVPQTKAYQWFGFEIKRPGIETYPKKTTGNAQLFVKILTQILFLLFMSVKFSYCSCWGLKKIFFWEKKLLTYWNSAKRCQLNLVLLSQMSCLLYLWLHCLDKILFVGCD